MSHSKNPVKVKELEKALKALGRGTLKEIAKKMDEQFPKMNLRHWETDEILTLSQGEPWMTQDASEPNEYVFTESKSEGNALRINRWWDN